MTKQCRICGTDNQTVLETHHIVPRRYGGNDKNENLVVLCSNCHTAIEKIYDDRFYEKLGFNPRSQSSSVTYNKTVELVEEFLNKRATVGKGGYERTTEVYDEFKRFANSQYSDLKIPHKVQFGKALQDLYPVDIKNKQLRFDGEPKNVYENVVLND